LLAFTQKLKTKPPEAHKELLVSLSPILPEVTSVKDLLRKLIFFVGRSASRNLFVLWLKVRVLLLRLLLVIVTIKDILHHLRLLTST
jgi:hypothetical protein